VGRPNAGKSTLLNTILTNKVSIVSSKPQTTQCRIAGLRSDEKAQMIIIDTPGIMLQPANGLEQSMIRTLKNSIREANCIIAIIDVSDDPEETLLKIQPRQGQKLPPVGVVLNKMDLVSPIRRQQIMNFAVANTRTEAIFECSALKNLGIESIINWSSACLPLSPNLYPQKLLSDHTERFFISEMIRGKILEMYGHEVPHCCKVTIIEYKERHWKHRNYINAEITVTKNSQKAILIGRGGARLKMLSISCRREIEFFLRSPIFLNVSVKLRNQKTE
jgi:GTP-binding protein Era